MSDSETTTSAPAAAPEKPRSTAEADSTKYKVRPQSFNRTFLYLDPRLQPTSSTSRLKSSSGCPSKAQAYWICVSKATSSSKRALVPCTINLSKESKFPKVCDPSHFLIPDSDCIGHFRSSRTRFPDLCLSEQLCCALFATRVRLFSLVPPRSRRLTSPLSHHYPRFLCSCTGRIRSLCRSLLKMTS